MTFGIPLDHRLRPLLALTESSSAGNGVGGHVDTLQYFADRVRRESHRQRSCVLVSSWIFWTGTFWNKDSGLPVRGKMETKL